MANLSKTDDFKDEYICKLCIQHIFGISDDTKCLLGFIDMASGKYLW